MTRDEIKTLVLSLPGAEEGTSYGYPSFKLHGKFLTRIRSEDDSLVVYVDGIDERDMLLEVDPETFFITDHYRGYPMVLARLDRIDPDWLRAKLVARWRRATPKRMQKALEAEGRAP